MRTWILALSGGVALLATGPAANAQWYGGPSWDGPYRYNAPPPPYGYDARPPGRPLPRGEIIDRLERAGFEEIGRIRFDGDVYTLEAVSPAGNPVQLVVDAYRGRVLRQAGLGGARLGRLEDDDVFDEPGFDRRRRGRAGPPDEMPVERRGGERFDPRPEPGRQATLPPVGPPAAGVPQQEDPPLARPTDPRLAPPGERRTGGPAGGDAPVAAAPREEPPRVDAPRRGPAASAPSGVYGVNPSGGLRAPAASDPKPASRSAAKPSGTANPPNAASPNAPRVPPIAGATPPAGPAVASETGERKPVRVIQGVTPMNSGEQSSPAPQNGVQSTGPTAGSK